MAIRDRFRRAVRKSVSAGPIRHTNTNLTMESNTSNESDESFSLSKNRFPLLSRAFTWGTRRSSTSDNSGNRSSLDNSDSNDNAMAAPGTMNLAQQIDLTLTRSASEAEREMKAEKKRMRKAKYKNGGAGKIHPRDKPLTAQNLRHQAMLGTWSWDESLNSSSRHSWVSGVSPCCTRAPSMHGGDDEEYFNLGGAPTNWASNGDAMAAPRERRTAMVGDDFE